MRDAIDRWENEGGGLLSMEQSEIAAAEADAWADSATFAPWQKARAGAGDSTVRRPGALDEPLHADTAKHGDRSAGTR